MSGRICDIILRQIGSQKLKPGMRLKEEQLTGVLGVSRTPLREAINRMVKEGYLEAEPRKGASVRKFKPKDIAEIYDIRMALECLAIRLALPNIDPKKLIELRSQFSGKDIKVLPEADTRLHYLIVHNCGNKRLIEMLDNLGKLVHVFRLAGYASPIRSKLAVSEHLQIIAALLKKDPGMAEKKLREHIENTKQQIIANFGNKQPQDHDEP